MFRKIIEILSWIRYPLDEAKRASCRQRWNILERIAILEKTQNTDLERRIAGVERSNGEAWGSIHNIWSNLWTLKSLLKGICKEDAENFSNIRERLSEKEHQENVDQLCHNLSPEAMERLQNILNKKDKLYYNGLVLLRDFFSESELSELDAVRKFHKETRFVSTPEGGHWQWRHYKLPGRLSEVKSISSISPIRFFATVFWDRHGIDLLKTTDGIGDKVIIDAGCWIGDSALVFREKFPSNTIYSFEPNPESYQLALETMALNNVENIVVENMGLGETRKTVNINGMFITSSNAEHKAVIETLDNYVREHNLRVGLIKTDLEGYEPNFFEGAINTIKEQRPILVISIYHTYDDFFKIKPLIESWNLGYTFDFFKGMDEGMGEIMLLAEVRDQQECCG